MTEPDVTLTDYALALECGVFCALALRWPGGAQELRRWWLLFFGAIGIASIVGGTVHGFFLAPGTINAVLWRATLLALGVASLAMWLIGSAMQLSEPVATWVRRAAIAQLITYVLVVLFVNSRFTVAIATYVPATLFLLVVMLLVYRRTGQASLLYGVAGLALTFVAAAVQQLRFAIHPLYFNHNALYHTIQAIALLAIFVGAKWTAAIPPSPPSPSSHFATRVAP